MEGSLVDFLSSCTDPEKLAQTLEGRIVSPFLLARMDHLILHFRPVEDGMEIRVTDFSLGGKPPSLREFEERLILLFSKGFEEVGREGLLQTDELECQECLKILPPNLQVCNSCHSKNLARGTIPNSITLMHLEPWKELTNEEFLDRIWQLVTQLGH